MLQYERTGILCAPDHIVEQLLEVRSDTQAVTQVSFRTFLRHMLAIENVQIQRTNVTEDEMRDTKRIAATFRALVEHRHAVARAESKEREEFEHLAENRFEPKLNRKSERLARKFMQEKGLESVRERERNRGKSGSKSIGRRSNSNGSVFSRGRNSMVTRLSRNRATCNSLPVKHDTRAKTRLEDFLIS